MTETNNKSWYVLHTYSGYEDNVARNLRQRIESMGMEDKILQVVVPREKKIRVKDGKRRTIEERLFPGYVLVEMIVTEDSWYVVRNTPNVTGFIGTGTMTALQVLVEPDVGMPHALHLGRHLARLYRPHPIVAGGGVEQHRRIAPVLARSDTAKTCG